MKIYEVDATVSTHELLKLGIVEAGLVLVRVAAESSLEAELVAGQMASVVGMVTGTYPRV